MNVGLSQATRHCGSRTSAKNSMRTTRVTVRFARGLHARPAASLVRLFNNYRSRVVLRLGHEVANARSILGILLLSATCNAQIEVQASGQDEDSAILAAEVFFQNADEEAAQQCCFGTSSDSRANGAPLASCRRKGDATWL
jgi:phosphocarrier protein HPr